MKKEVVKQYSLVDNIKYAIKMLMQKDKIVVFLLVIAVFIEMLISLVSVYFPKFVVEQVEMSVGLVRLSSSILLAAIIIGSLYFISKFINTKANWHLITIQAEYIWDLYMHSISCPYMDVASASGQNKYQRAKDSVFQGDTGCIRTIIPAVLNSSIGISDYDPSELRKVFSTVFQDSNVFPFTVAENIAMSEKNNTDLERVLNCIETADLAKKIEGTRDGVSSQVLKIIDSDGLIMSGGEMQKLYLARALYKNGSIMILDEPTAALDPIAERNQYLQYETICKNKIAIYISHRLASTSFCDKIAFLENGRIMEYGSHDELIKLGGKYNSMFEIQREYYKEENEDSELVKATILE